MTRIVLVRHGMHDWIGRGIAGRRPDVSLNGEGLMQAKQLAERLADVRLDAIYSSPQPRARQTAEPIAQRKNLPVFIAPEFDEIGFGEWEGLSFADLERDHHDRWCMWVERRSQAHPPGGEAFTEVRDRAMAGMDRLTREHPDQHVLVACHGDIVKVIVATHLRMSLDDLETFDVPCCSLTVIDRGPGWAQVKQVAG